MKNKFTIITVVFNNRAGFEKTLNSVVSQDFPDVEYIVIDGGSTDGTVEMIKQNEIHITEWISEKDNGIYNAMNKGISRATGDWVCFLNGGDVFADSKVLSKVAQAVENTNAKIVYGNHLMEKNGKKIEIIAKEPCNLHHIWFCHQSAFVRLPLLQRIRFDENHKLSADFKFFKQCYYEKCRFLHLHFPVAVFDKSGISNTERNKGLRDNMAVVKSTDKGFVKWKFLLKLWFVITWRKINGEN
ncbi:MAG: glycosyltransferase [Prevotellaceae bacterium]|jgi:glycosyltransferase involved in cell wall biosynthesis|nr:glycosyltransferase [Prevotellaceae bacterium]